MPGDLYRFMDRRQDPVVLKINGRTTTAEVVRGFAVIDRTWSPGDAIELTLPMPVRRVVADPRVKDASGRVALERGPLVYNDQNDDVAAVYAGVSPLSSADESNLYFRMRPPVGQPAWVEYTFKKPATITTTDVYFADDRRFCRLPASWRLLYRDGDGWKPVAARQPYEVRTDQFNHVEFEPITATAVRIEIEPVTRHYKSGEIGPPDAMFLNEDIDWRELGVIEWRMK